MNIHPDNRTAFEFDNMVEIGLLENKRVIFLSRPSIMLNLIPIADGKEWSVIYGGNLMEGVCGFGDSPDEAMLD